MVATLDADRQLSCQQRPGNVFVRAAFFGEEVQKNFSGAIAVKSIRLVTVCLVDGDDVADRRDHCFASGGLAYQVA